MLQPGCIILQLALALWFARDPAAPTWLFPE
jgi:hypothetical protein